MSEALALPDLFTARQSLRPILPSVYRALESGAQDASIHFEHAVYEFEGGLHASIVRASCRHWLKQQEFELEDLPSNGICLHHGDFRIRILKAREDTLPETNQSKARLQFFKQEPLLIDAEFQPDRWNLLVLWNIDNKLRLTDLRVACTKPVDDDPEGYETYWEFPIENPVKTIAPTPIAEDDDEDLGYSLPDRDAADESTVE
jgi:hypothetical protein